MKDCPECETDNMMYERWNDYRCAKCGYIFTHDPPDHLPTREQDSKCGDIISGNFDGVQRACVRKKNCQDGTLCSVTPSTIVHLKNDLHMVVCTFHDDE